jgi:filamentous hemagglutinin
LKGEKAMSKGGSGHFKGTNGATAEVWDNITSTQPNYVGTEIPRSFVITTPDNTFWVHGNATEHMAEYVIKQANTGHSLGSTRLDSQIILSDMHASLSEVTKGDIKYNTSLQHGNWEFIIKKSNDSGKYDAVIHAMYNK